MERTVLRRERVYDPVLRSIHAWNALCVVLLAASGQTADLLRLDWPAAALWRLHLWLGYALVVGLSARLAWALAGPAHARWRALWWPREWFAAPRRRRYFTAPDGPGHHRLASAAYLGLYLLAVLMAGSGLVLAAIDQGTGPLREWLGYAVELKPWFRVPHAWLQYAVIAFVVAHLGALILHEARHGVPMAQAMLSGYQYFKENDDVSTPTPAGPRPGLRPGRRRAPQSGGHAQPDPRATEPAGGQPRKRRPRRKAVPRQDE
jgi:Ni,Fe-hydrogenase I cytochrome b subunit